MPRKGPDLVGRQFGRLLVLRISGADKNGTRVQARCACGEEGEYRGNSLTSGNTKSCGCLARERTSVKGNYGPEYWCWVAIKTRCYNPRDPSYARYGARGIAVCDRWRGSYQNFLADMGPRPSPGHSIDRIDTYGNYEPGNCRWATVDVQARNRRNNVWLTFQGETLVVADWARRLGVRAALIGARLRAGWSAEAALTIQSGRRRATHCKKGHEYTPENTISWPSKARACRECRRTAPKKERKPGYWRNWTANLRRGDGPRARKKRGESDRLPVQEG